MDTNTHIPDPDLLTPPSTPREARPRRRLRSLPTALVVLAASALAFGGGATAAGLIDGKDIKPGTVSSKQIKNGTIRLKDVKASDVAKLKGKDGTNGTNGTNGAPGASAFAPPPSGTIIRGGGQLNAVVSGAGIVLREYSPLPFTLPVRLSDAGAGRNLFYGASATPVATEVNTTRCPGTAAAPTATPGTLCVYVQQAVNLAPATSVLFAGADSANDEAEFSGFSVRIQSAAAGDEIIRYIWVYNTP